MLELPNDYEHVYIVCYPQGAGGNFLINCLALNDNFVFFNSSLARQQLDGKFGINDKVRYLHNKLHESAKTKKWNDLDLGNGQFYGLMGNEPRTQFPEILSFRINAIVEEVIDSGKGFFWICSNILDIPTLKKSIWPRAKIIFFRDYMDFLRARPGYNRSDAKIDDLNDYWQIVRDESWPTDPPTDMEQFQQLPLDIHTELTEVFKFEIARWLDLTRETACAWHKRVDIMYEKYRDDSTIWSVDEAYSNEEKMISCLRVLCERFGLEAPEDRYIGEYFKLWRHVIADCTP